MQGETFHLYHRINAGSSQAALAWYRGLRHVIRSLRDNPYRSPATPENEDLRHLLYGNRPHIYRGIYRITERHKEVNILHIRHGARQGFKTADLT